MKNGTKLSVLGWVALIALFVGLNYWLNQPVSAYPTGFGILNIIAKTCVIIMVTVTQMSAFDKSDKDYIAMPLLVTSSITMVMFLIFGAHNIFHMNGGTLLAVYQFVSVITLIFSIGLTAIITVCLLFMIPQSLIENFDIIVNDLKYNKFGKLFFKQSKPNKKVKM